MRWCRSWWIAAFFAALLMAVSFVTVIGGSTASAAGVVALGTQTVGGTVDSNAAGQAEAFQATATVTGTIASLSLYVDSSSKATSATVGVYTDNGGQPGTLLTQGSVASPLAGSWNTVDVPAAPLTAGTAYWISVLGPVGAGTLSFRDVQGGTTSLSSSQTTLTSLPSTWSSGASWPSSPVSAYATLAATGPSLSVTPLAVDMETTVGSNPLPAHVSITNSGIGTLDYTASSDATWLSVSPPLGAAPQTLSLTPATSGLSTGTYTGHVTLSATGAVGSPQVVTVTLAVEPASGATPADWPTVDHDLNRSGTAPAEAALGVGNAASLAPSWSDTLDGKVTAQPQYLGAVQVAGATHDTVIAATTHDTVYALDAHSGAVLWSDHLATAPANCSVPGGFGITSTPVVDRATGKIYAVTDDGDLRTLSLSTGAQLTTALPVVASPSTNNVWGGLTLFDGNLYIPTASNGCDTPPYQGGIYQVGVAGATPVLLNHWLTVPNLPASEAGGGIWGYGGLSVDTTTGHVYAASADDATGLTGDEGYTPYSGSLLALDQEMNLLGWYQAPQPANYNCGEAPPCDQDFAATPLIFQPAGCPAMLAAGNKNGNLYVVSEANLQADTGNDGSKVQVIKLNDTFDDLGLGGLFGTPVYDPVTNMVYVTDSGSGVTGVKAGLVALSVQADCSLQVAWSDTVGTPVSNSPNSTPTLANGVIYVGVNNGKVAAFNAATGASLWTSAASGAAVYPAPVVANGEVFAGSWNGFTSAAAGTIAAWTPTSALGVGVSPSTLSFSGTIGQPDPAAQSVSITPGSSGATSYTVTTNSSWLSATPTGGAVPGMLSVHVSTTSLAAGTYTGSLTVTPNVGTAQTVSVTFVVNPAATKPGQPTGVAAVPGSGAATVSWTAPSDGGSPITSYTVTPFAGSTALTPTLVSGSGSSPPLTSTTVSGLTNGTAYTFTVSATNVVGTGPVSTPSPAVTPEPTAAPVLDANVSVQAATTTATTARFSTVQAGERLVAFVSSDGPQTGGQSVTVSGAGLTWSLVVRAATQAGDAEIWTATAPTALKRATVSSKETAAGYQQLLVVQSYEGSGGLGAAATSGAATGAPTIDLATVGSNSLVLAVGDDWDAATGRTLGANQTMVDQWVDSATQDTFWVQRLTAAVAAPSRVTLNDTAPTTDRWNMAAVEITGG